MSNPANFATLRLSFLSSHSRAPASASASASAFAPRRFMPPVSRPRVFVYANALQAVISSHERWATAKPAMPRTNDTVRRARDRAVSDIGNPPHRRESEREKERAPSGNGASTRQSCIREPSFEKSRIFPRYRRVSARRARFAILRTGRSSRRCIHDIYKTNLGEI